jgi:hypothetical protein
MIDVWKVGGVAAVAASAAALGGRAPEPEGQRSLPKDPAYLAVERSANTVSSCGHQPMCKLLVSFCTFLSKILIIKLIF